MGKVFSSQKHYNRALATSPRKSIALTRIDTSCVQQEPLVGTLSIPYPVRISESNETITDSINQTSPITNKSLSPPSNPPSRTEYCPQPQQQEAPIIQSPSSFSPISSPSPSQIMSTDPMIIRRSVINLNKHRRTSNSHLTSYTPRPAIVERNGKQFVTEIKERMERRYVQIYDEMTGQMRLFEVTDYIPTRTVQSVRNSPQLAVQSNTHRSSFSARPPSRNMNSDRTELTTPSNLLDFKNLHKRETVDEEFNLYHSGAALASANQNNNTVPLAAAPSHESTDSSYSDVRSKGYNSPIQPTSAPANEYSPSSYQSQPRSYRAHSPTASDYSVSTNSARSMSENSDRESINRALIPTPHRNRSTRNDSNVSYGTLNGQSSSIQLDPFAKTARTGNHIYTRRQGINPYSQPRQQDRGVRRTGNADYSPLTKAPTRSSRDYRKDSNVYES